MTLMAWTLVLTAIAHWDAWKYFLWVYLVPAMIHSKLLAPLRDDLRIIDAGRDEIGLNERHATPRQQKSLGQRICR